MLDLPIYIPGVFILTTLLTLFFCFQLISQSSAKDKTGLIIGGIVLWLVVQGVLTYTGVYRSNLDQIPPRLLLFGAIPTFVMIVILMYSSSGKKFVDSLSLSALTWLSVVRIPVELCLYWLALHKAVPELMSFAGRNFDILAGLTAPLVVYFGIKKDGVKPMLLWIWNIGGLLLLVSIIIQAILSAPFPLQQLAFDQPNLALLYFPFQWLGTFVAPVVLFSHLIWIRRLLNRTY